MLGRLTLEAIWSGIAALGAQILFMGLRTRLGPGYAWFGAFLLSLAALFFVPVWAPEAIPEAWPGYAAYGLAAAGIVCVAGVARLLARFLALHAANRETMEHLAEAFNVLRESAGLTALGAEAATISHEIRNYAATLRGNALLMRRGMGDLDDEGYRAEVDRIRATAEKLEAVSRDIAVYSSAALPGGETRCALDVLARACAREAFPQRAQDIRIGAWPAGLAVRGDAGMLERVFLNLFRNAFEAGAGAIEVRFRSFRGRLVAAVEDDGAGCAPRDLDRLSVPFFTGKQGGTGLGCAIVASTLAGHGASFRAYTRNALRDAGTGLILNMVFPLDGAGPSGSPAMPVAFSDPAARADLIAPLVNLGIQPLYLAPNHPPPAGAAGMPPPAAEAALAPRLAAGWPRGVLSVDADRTARWIGGPSAGAPPFLYSEENLAAIAEGVTWP